MDEYLLFYKEHLPPADNWRRRWDVFISAYNSSDRVELIADRVRARTKIWLMLPEYGYGDSDGPTSGSQFAAVSENEAEYVCEFIERHRSCLLEQKVVVDISGFIGHYVLALIGGLCRVGVKEIDVLYGEPVRYLHSERTRFSDEDVMDVRQVVGFEGVHTTDTNDDMLILGAGYDSRLIAEVASNKEHAQKVQLFGFPSLRPDMFQENLLRASLVAEAIGPEATVPQHFRYAPANDPFVTASVVSAVVRQHRTSHPRANVYLCPLATKAQALGFALFYLRECQATPTSIIYPFCRTYMKETSEGLSGVWRYRLELERMRQMPVVGEL